MTEPMVRRHPDAEAAVRALAESVTALAVDTVRERGAFRLALAGGETPRRLYEVLARPHVSRRISWERVHVFWGDERCVPFDDPRSNYAMARDSLLERVGVPSANVHPVDCRLGSEAAAADYERVIGELPMDLVLLGIGTDGHTASLFPDTPGLATENRRVVATRSPVAPFERVSMSLRTINEAEHVAFLVTGGHKADALAAVLGQSGRRDARLPAAMVRPGRGRLLWFVDDAAAQPTRGGEDPGC